MKKLIICLSIVAATPLSAHAQFDPFGGIKKAAEGALRGALPPALQSPAVQPVTLAPTLSIPPADQQAYDNAAENYKRTVTQGTVIGFVGGLLICTNVLKEDWAKAACTLGVTWATREMSKKIADRNQKLVTDRNKVLEQIEEGKKSRAVATALLDATEKNISYLENEIADQKKKLGARQITQAQYQANLNEALKQSKQLDAGLSNMHTELTTQHDSFVDLQKRAAVSPKPDIQETAPALQQQAEEHDSFLKGRPAQVVEHVKQVTTQLEQLGAT